MDGQMTIFDFIPGQKKNGYNFPPIIEELSKDIWNLFKTDFHGDEEYEVWPHVPNLGKRYCIWIDIDDLDQKVMDFIRDKYKKYDLEISYSACPNYYDNEVKVRNWNLMISSLWKTKGHKERLDEV